MAQGSEVNLDFGNQLLHKLGWGVPCWLNGSDSGFSLPWAQVPFEVGELRSLKLCSPAKKLKKKKKKKKGLLNKQGWNGQFMLKAIVMYFKHA